jgi:hypothetical protein
MRFSERQQAWIETALVLGVFFLQGAFPAPEVNEPYYLGKAIHFWNPAWGAGDFFLDSADAHQVFYFTFGWLALVLPPLALAWTGRIITWALLAWAWRRLSWAMAPKPWLSVLSAALFVAALDRFHMAGEWVLGGVEAKGFAYVLVLLGLEALLRGRWNRMWLLFGAGAAFHVLVGGWAVVAAAVVWASIAARRRAANPLAPPVEAPSLGAMLPGLIGGGLLSLLGLVPVLMLNWGVDREIVGRAQEIYVFERLYHHLDPLQLPPVFVVRFVLLCAGWGLLCLLAPATSAARLLRRFTASVLLIALIGGLIGLLSYVDRGWAASLLRYYWFRLSDVVVPLAVALEAVAYLAGGLEQRNVRARVALIVAVLLAAAHVGQLAMIRPVPRPPRADKLPHFQAWRAMNQWIAASPDFPAGARFLTPRQAHTFKWYTGRAEVVNWKEIPQDAASIVEWFDRLQEIFGTTDEQGRLSFREWPGELPAEELERLGRKYDFQYVVTLRRDRLPFRQVHANDRYVVYELPAAGK